MTPQPHGQLGISAEVCVVSKARTRAFIVYVLPRFRPDVNADEQPIDNAVKRIASCLRFEDFPVLLPKRVLRMVGYVSVYMLGHGTSSTPRPQHHI